MIQHTHRGLSAPEFSAVRVGVRALVLAAFTGLIPVGCAGSAPHAVTPEPSSEAEAEADPPAPRDLCAEASARADEALARLERARAEETIRAWGAMADLAAEFQSLGARALREGETLLGAAVLDRPFNARRPSIRARIQEGTERINVAAPRLALAIETADPALAAEAGGELGAASERISVASMEVGSVARIRNVGSDALDSLEAEGASLEERYFAARDLATAASARLAAVDRAAVLASDDAAPEAVSARDALQVAERECAAPQSR